MPLVAIVLNVDESDLAQLSHDTIAARIPGWNPGPSDFMVPLIESNARIASMLLTMLAEVPDEIAIGIGTGVFGLPMDDAASATATARFTLSVAGGAPGVTIPAGTQFGMTLPDLTTQAFQTTDDLLIAGVATTGDVNVVATEAGSLANGLIGTGFMLQATDAPITSVQLLTAAANGADAETTDAYLAKLRGYAALLTPTPILPQDFANMAMTVDGVSRALAVDLYDAATNTYAHQRTIFVAVHDAVGQPTSSAVKTAVDALLQSNREQNWTIVVGDPVYTSFTVSANVTASTGVDHATLQAGLVAVLQELFNPATHGGPTGDGQPLWQPQPVIHVNQVIAALGAYPGVQNVNSVTLNGASVDVTMNGGRPHALPTLTATPTITVV